MTLEAVKKGHERESSETSPSGSGTRQEVDHRGVRKEALERDEVYVRFKVSSL